MTRHDYETGKTIHRQGHSFAALLQAAMRAADSHNMALLGLAFPDVLEELRLRYGAPGGILESDLPWPR